MPLYANGPFLTLVRELKLGAVLIAKKESDEPLKEALSILGNTPPHKTIDDDASRESIELWDVNGIETLESYNGKIRVVRGRVKKSNGKTPSTWCMLVTGMAGKLSANQVPAVARGRWHIENTGFNQWVSYWNLNQCLPSYRQRAEWRTPGPAPGRPPCPNLGLSAKGAERI